MRRSRRHVAALMGVTSSLAVVAGCSEPNTPPAAVPGAVLVHPAGWADPDASAFHGNALAALRYDFSECIECHGTGAGGGIAGVACATCHTSPDGPEACNTCHGDFDADPADLTVSAPPRGLDGEIDSRSPAVGAHVRHLQIAPDRSALDRCGECHAVPATLDAPGHLGDDLRAEVPLAGTIATVPSAGGILQPAGTWDPGPATCSNTYCHGNWTLLESMSDRKYMYAADRIEGNAATPVWTDPESAGCGTCHELPPVGHDAAEIHECVDCHETVINAAGEIIDPSKHVDGRIDLFDESYPMF